MTWHQSDAFFGELVINIAHQEEVTITDISIEVADTAIRPSGYPSQKLVLATTQIRRSEVAGLRWVDIDLDAPRIGIRQALGRRRRGVRGRGRHVDLDRATVTDCATNMNPSYRRRRRRGGRPPSAIASTVGTSQGEVGRVTIAANYD